MTLNNIKYFRYFEVTARLGSIVAAAQELGVTPAAISQQIRCFEQNYNIRLFNRLPNSLVLPDVTRALHIVDTVVGSIQKDDLKGELVVNCAPSFGLQWLMPKIKDFICTYSQISLTICSNEFPSSKDIEKFDLRIVHGTGDYPHFNSQLLMTEEVFPILSPALQAAKPIHSFEDLRNHTLLHDMHIEPSETSLKWRRWLECADNNISLSKYSLNFCNANLMLDAARRGLGVALGRSAILLRAN